MKSLFILLISVFALADEFYPANILRMDPALSHHLILVDKSAHRLYVYRADKKGRPELVKDYSVATGKFTGDKKVQGDHKTPEGIYDMTNFRPSSELISSYGKEGEIYGAGAFVLNYPNVFDRRHGKTGGGIWLHSTNDNSRVAKGLDSKGCVVSVDDDLFDISKYIELQKTPFIIAQDRFFLREPEWLDKRKTADELLAGWLKAWQDEDFQSYISYYHSSLYRDNYRTSFPEFSAYKKAVFSNPGQPEINVDNITILTHRDHMVIRFVQSYKSNTINDRGLKTLYLKQNSRYEWKIINEQWSKFTADLSEIAFTPSQRFFNQDKNQSQALLQAQN